MTPIEIIGQILGITATVIMTLSYQINNKGRLLLIQMLGTALMCVHYLLIGGMSGFWLNVVGVARNLAYFFSDRFPWINKVAPLLFTALMALMSALTWHAWYSVFIALGLIINTYCLSIKDTQTFRKTILITCPLVFIYNTFVMSVGGMLNESISFTSAAVGLYRYRKNK